ncbi:liprin-beta-2 isoform X2 [Daktulosphaira vitifoliae]|uniref:liprin-beta-2 isoform X2 n=1 Tax=Daktulosphaira vitifoliae TaxID=58002 RepID=UPI0021A9904F|nr:liprin-beta-2 isoform X2 [Daktulosphaira vitifoliae]
MSFIQENEDVNKTHIDAIKLLEGALQKMDSIILSEPTNTHLPNSPDTDKVSNNNLDQKKNENCEHLESFKLQVSMLNDQVDILLRKLNHLEKYLSQQNELRLKAEKRLCEEIDAKSRLEIEKLEAMALLTNLKLENVKLSKENMELKELLIINLNNSNFQRSKSHGPRFYSSLPRHILSKNKELKDNDNNNITPLNDITESCANLFGNSSQFDKFSSAPNLIDVEIKGQHSQISRKNQNYLITNSNLLQQNSNVPFSQWDRKLLFEWFSNLRLEYILNQSKSWPILGSDLLSASFKEIDEKIHFNHWLHRKKLILEIQCEKNRENVFVNDKYLLKARFLNTAWVLHWLDDIGLPQYKESFSQAAVNGTVLHRLTKDDFLTMQNVNSELHLSSLRCGIKVLRENQFDPECLTRRSNSNNSEDNHNLSLWTTHRVMEWLCFVNLAEYASNLRGSGVHGGLIVYDDRFTSDLLADILFIQQNKTLLRRHLSIQFNELIGTDLNKKKRDVQSQAKFKPLTMSSRVKGQKKSQFSLKRKKNYNEMIIGDLICPLENEPKL